jgi:hypothetical protein
VHARGIDEASALGIPGGDREEPFGGGAIAALLCRRGGIETEERIEALLAPHGRLVSRQQVSCGLGLVAGVVGALAGAGEVATGAAQRGGLREPTRTS